MANRYLIDKLKGLSIAGLNTVLMLAVSIIVSKIVSILFGPAGITHYAQLKQSAQLFTLCAGVNSQGVSTVVLSKNAKKNRERTRQIIAFLTLNSTLVAAFSLTASAFKENAIGAMFPSISSLEFLVAGVFGLVISFGPIFFYSRMQGAKLLKLQSLSSIMAASLCMAFYYGEIQEVLYYSVAYGFSFVLVILIFKIFTTPVAIYESPASTLSKKKIYFVGKTIKRFRFLYGYLFFKTQTFLFAGLANIAVVIVVRKLYLVHYGVEMAGNYDAALSFSVMLAAIVTSALSARYVPELSKLKSSDESDKCINDYLIIVTRGGFLVAIVVLMLTDFIRTTLYSAEFIYFNELIVLQVVAEYLKVTCFVMGAFMLSTASGGMFLVTELVNVGLQLVVAYCLSAHTNLFGPISQITSLAMYYVMLTAFILPKLRASIKWQRKLEMILLFFILLGFAINRAI